MLAWEDEDFVVGVFDDQGRFLPGKAAKWRASEELMKRMEDVGGDEDQIGDQGIVVHEEEEEEKNILYGCIEQDETRKEEGKCILYGCKQQENDEQEVREVVGLSPFLLLR